MKILSNSQITQLLGVQVGNQIQKEFDSPITVTMKPKYGSVYQISCIGVFASELDKGKSTVHIIYF